MMKRVCIIGAGISGLSCIHQLETLNIDYICYEKRSELGGLWNYSETETSVYKNCLQNHPRKYMSINDCSIDNTKNDYVTHEEYLDYLRQFNSEKIKYNSSVSNTHYNNNKSMWEVTVNNEIELFSDLVICSGHYTNPRIPDEYKSFTGELLHSVDYKVADKFENKSVLVIGGGSSAIQIASDLVGSAKEITLSIRTMPYIFRRYVNNQTLFDFYKSSTHTLDTEIDDLLYKYKEHQTLYNIPAPNQELLSSSTIPICDDIFSYSKENKIKYTGKVVSIDKNIVKFDHYKSKFDVIILATGYDLDFDFLDFKVDYSHNLYHVINKNHPSLYFIGMLQPIGPVPRLLDIQSKLVGKLINGDIDLNPADKKNIQMNKRVNLGEYIKLVTPLLEAVN